YPCDLMLCYTPISSLIPYSTLIRSLLDARSFYGFLIRVYFRALRHSECPHRFNQRIEDQLPPSEVWPFLAILNLTKILTEGHKECNCSSRIHSLDECNKRHKHRKGKITCTIDSCFRRSIPCPRGLVPCTSTS